eukprot:m.1040070 g.1040070  ORF g.1040070 m.1040070 type:complete len:67 (+) comp24152_c0_seq10:4441-4641(+)
MSERIKVSSAWSPETDTVAGTLSDTGDDLCAGARPIDLKNSSFLARRASSRTLVPTERESIALADS